MSTIMSNTAAIISKVWSFCNTLRDDGVGYGDYLEQLTYLLFLKMADEYAKPPYNRRINIPAQYTWDSLTSRRGAELEAHYIRRRHTGQRRTDLQSSGLFDSPWSPPPGAAST